MDNFQNLYYQLMQAYFCVRKNKRNTQNQIAFELNLEHNIYVLAKSIFNKKYTPKRSIAFVVNKPVKREIFAADFLDRVVHHLIYIGSNGNYWSSTVNGTNANNLNFNSSNANINNNNRANGFSVRCIKDNIAMQLIKY